MEAIGAPIAAALEGGIEPDAARVRVEKRLRVHTLGDFRVEKEGEPLRFLRKVPRRPLELLKVTIALGGRAVDTRRIIDWLWPDAEGDAAEKALASALHRLRLLLGDAAALVVEDRRLSIDGRRAWVDVWALEQLFGGRDSAAVDFDQVLALYRGAFLESEDGPWAWPLRERLRGRVLRELARRGQRLLEDERCEEAIHLFEKGLEIEELAEELYCKLMRCYQSLGRRAEALRVYERCRLVISSRLGVEPSPATEALHHALREHAWSEAGPKATN